MRRLLLAALAVAAIGASTANAQYWGRETGDGCSNNGWCEPGARPGVPRYYSDIGRYRGRYRGPETGDGCSNNGWCERGARPGVPRYYSNVPQYGGRQGNYMRDYPERGCGVDRHGPWHCWRQSLLLTVPRARRRVCCPAIFGNEHSTEWVRESDGASECAVTKTDCLAGRGDPLHTRRQRTIE